MEFGAGFLLGGVVTGLALSNGKLLHGWLSRLESSAKQKAEAARKAFDARL